MAQPYSYTVRQLVYELGQYLNDAQLLNASGAAADTTHFLTTELAGLTADSLVASELWPWDRPLGDASLSLFPPYLVTANTVGGLLTLNKVIFSLPHLTGARAVLQNFNGRGYPQFKKEFALKMACMELAAVTASTVQTITTPSTSDFWNNLPASLRSVYRIAGYSAATGYEFEIMPATWQDRIDLAGWRVNVPFDWQASDTLRVYGRADPTAWWDALRPNLEGSGAISLTAYTTVVPGDPRKIIQAALPWLLDGKRDDKAAEMTQFAYARTQREMRDRAFPGEVFRL